MKKPFIYMIISIVFLGIACVYLLFNSDSDITVVDNKEISKELNLEINMSTFLKVQIKKSADADGITVQKTPFLRSFKHYIDNKVISIYDNIEIEYENNKLIINDINYNKNSNNIFANEPFANVIGLGNWITFSKSVDGDGVFSYPNSIHITVPKNIKIKNTSSHEIKLIE
jgi:hypothetical protein